MSLIPLTIHLILELLKWSFKKLVTLTELTLSLQTDSSISRSNTSFSCSAGPSRRVEQRQSDVPYTWQQIFQFNVLQDMCWFRCRGAARLQDLWKSRRTDSYSLYIVRKTCTYTEERDIYLYIHISIHTNRLCCSYRLEKKSVLRSPGRN